MQVPGKTLPELTTASQTAPSPKIPGVKIVRGYELVAMALARQGVDSVFFLMGGPMLGVATACVDARIRMIDVRHEQAAAMMAHAYARVRTTAGVCMACSGQARSTLQLVSPTPSSIARRSWRSAAQAP